MKLRFTLALTAWSFALNTAFIESAVSSSSSALAYSPGNAVPVEYLSGAAPSGFASQVQPIQYTLDKATALKTFALGCVTGAGVGGLTYALAGSDTFSLSPTNAKRLAWGMVAGTGLVFTLGNNGRIAKIDQTRHNMENDPRAFDTQVTEKLSPILNERGAAVQSRIDAANNAHSSQRQSLQGAISRINDNHAAISYLPGQIEALQNSIPGKKQACAELERSYNALLRQGVTISDAEREVGRAKFDAQVSTANLGLNTYKAHRTANQPVKTLTDFLPQELINLCPCTLNSNTLDGRNVGEFLLPAWRESIATSYAKSVAERRHEDERRAAFHSELHAQQVLRDTEFQIINKTHRLNSITESGYGNREVCDAWIAEKVQQIESNKVAHAVALTQLTAEKNTVLQPNPEDIGNVTAEITESCSSASKSWYQGFYTSGITAMAVATVGFAYTWFNS